MERKVLVNRLRAAVAGLLLVSFFGVSPAIADQGRGRGRGHAKHEEREEYWDASKHYKHDERHYHPRRLGATIASIAARTTGTTANVTTARRA